MCVCVCVSVGFKAMLPLFMPKHVDYGNHLISHRGQVNSKSHKPLHLIREVRCTPKRIQIPPLLACVCELTNVCMIKFNEVSSTGLA